MLSNRPLLRYLRDRLGDDARIEDLPKPFVVATTDLDTRQAVHLSSGPLAEAIVASSAVNGIFPPVTIGDQRLVDGGASDPVPVGVLRSMGADIVIAVNVMEIGRGAAGLYTPRFRIPLPGIIDNLMIGLDTVMSQAAVQSCRTADIIVAPRERGRHVAGPPAGREVCGGRSRVDAGRNAADSRAPRHGTNPHGRRKPTRACGTGGDPEARSVDWVARCDRGPQVAAA